MDLTLTFLKVWIDSSWLSKKKFYGFLWDIFFSLDFETSWLHSCDQWWVRGNGLRLTQGRLGLDSGARFFAQRVAGHWNRFPRTVVPAPNLTEFKCLDCWGVLGRASRIPVCPFQLSLFCHSMISMDMKAYLIFATVIDSDFSMLGAVMIDMIQINCLGIPNALSHHEIPWRQKKQKILFHYKNFIYQISAKPTI